MRDKVADLMLRNRQEVFNERDASRRIAAIKAIYAREAVLFEGNERIRGQEAISAKVGAVQGSFPPDFRFSPTGTPTRTHDLGRLTWRGGPGATPPVVAGMDVALFQDGRIRSLYMFLGAPADKSARVRSF